MVKPINVHVTHVVKLPHIVNLWQKTPLDVFGGVPKQIPLVDVVIVRCLEDLGWVVDWLKRILRDEWTPEVMGVVVRLVIYEKCQAA